jgi:hypothetical protein
VKNGWSLIMQNCDCNTLERIIIIIIIVVVVVILVITFMQGIYNYICGRNRFSTVYNVAAVPYLQFGLQVIFCISPTKYILNVYISTFRSMCALPSMAVFWSSLISCLPGMLSGTV